MPFSANCAIIFNRQADNLEVHVDHFRKVSDHFSALCTIVSLCEQVVVVVYPRRVFEESTACGESYLPGFRRKVSPVPPTRAVLLCGCWGEVRVVKRSQMLSRN